MYRLYVLDKIRKGQDARVTEAPFMVTRVPGFYIGKPGQIRNGCLFFNPSVPCRECTENSQSS